MMLELMGGGNLVDAMHRVARQNKVNLKSLVYAR
jgi:hypothetical protein